jgi:hypothetical protein
MSRGQRGGSPTAVNLSFLDRSLYLFLSNSSSVILTRLSGPRSRHTICQKIWRRRESNPGPLGLQPETLTTRPQRRSLHSSHTAELSVSKQYECGQVISWVLGHKKTFCKFGRSTLTGTGSVQFTSSSLLLEPATELLIRFKIILNLFCVFIAAKRF